MSTNDLRKQFDEFLQKDFPAAYASRNKHGIDVWIDFAFQCYLQGRSDSNMNALGLLEAFEKKVI